jgi:intraflagellar transport protein 46
LKNSSIPLDSGLQSELNELFKHIDRFKPMDIELETELKPFIPDYIPAIGDIDAFIKVFNQLSGKSFEF